MAANGMEAAMIQLQKDLAQTRNQMAMMATSHDDLARAHEALKNQSDNLFRQRADDPCIGRQIVETHVHPEVRLVGHEGHAA